MTQQTSPQLQAGSPVHVSQIRTDKMLALSSLRRVKIKFELLLTICFVSTRPRHTFLETLAQFSVTRVHARNLHMHTRISESSLGGQLQSMSAHKVSVLDTLADYTSIPATHTYRVLGCACVFVALVSTFDVYVYVYVYVCVFVCARACIDVCVRVSVNVCLHACAVPVSMSISMSVSVSVSVSISLSESLSPPPLSLFLSLPVYFCVCICICIFLSLSLSLSFSLSLSLSLSVEIRAHRASSKATRLFLTN